MLFLILLISLCLPLCESLARDFALTAQIYVSASCEVKLQCIPTCAHRDVCLQDTFKTFVQCLYPGFLICIPCFTKLYLRGLIFVEIVIVARATFAPEPPTDFNVWHIELRRAADWSSVHCSRTPSRKMHTLCCRNQICDRVSSSQVMSYFCGFS